MKKVFTARCGLVALLLFLAAGIPSFAQLGSSCANPVTITPNGTCVISDERMAGGVYWARFTAGSPRMQIKVQQPLKSSSTPVADVVHLTLYEGDCGSLSLKYETEISLANGGTTAEITCLNQNAQYFIKLDGANGSNGYFGLCAVNIAVPVYADCFNAYHLCSKTVDCSTMLFGTGTDELINNGSCIPVEEPSIWYTFTVNQNGNINFQINPANFNLNDDLDFVVFDITPGITTGCAGILAGTNTAIRCSYANSPGAQTGTDPSASENTDLNLDGYVAPIANTGCHTYALCIIRDSGPSQTFQLTFTGTSVSFVGQLSPSFTPSSGTFCAPATITFTNTTPSGSCMSNVSWQWNFGSGANPATSSAENPGPVTYSTGGTRTITLKAVTPCGTTTWSSNIVIDAPNLTATASPGSICKGSATQLNATGSSFAAYSWSPGTGLSCTNCPNPVATPSVTTSYTVTGTTASGCTASSSVAVNVNPLPVCTITGSTPSACGTGTYTTTANSSCSYVWTIVPPAPFTGQGTNSIQADFTANPNQNYVIGVTVTNTVTNCTSTCSYDVGSCCVASGTPQPGIPPYFYNSSSSGYPAVLSGPMAINGTFTVNSNCTFRAADIRMGYNAKIIVQPGYTLTITDNSGTTSKLYACDYMWDGIYISGNTASLIVNNGSSIEDAQNAVVSNSGGVYTIGGSPVNGTVKLNKNWKSIVVNSYTGVHSGTVTGTLISSRSGVTIRTYASTPAHTLRYPHLGQRSNVGIEVNGITNVTALAIGNPSSASLINYFDYMDYGIKGTNSNIMIRNNEFMNITGTSVISRDPAACLVGTAICVKGLNTFASRTVTVGGPGTNEPNTIHDGLQGIHSSIHLNLKATHNTFRNLNTGIFAGFSYLKNVTMNNNSFRDNRTGISTYDLRVSQVQIQQNGMNMNNTSNATGIHCTEIWPSTQSSLIYTINSNTIDSLRNGIVCLGLRWAKIENNFVKLKHTASASQYGRGIYGKNIYQSLIRKNNILGQNANDWWMEGIRLDICAANTVSCNTTTKLGSGEFFSAPQPFTYFTRNSMTDNLWGLLINSGMIGPQGYSGNPNDNTWNGTFGQAMSYAFYSNGALSPFSVQPGLPFQPNNNTSFSGTPIPFMGVTGTSSYSCGTGTIIGSPAGMTEETALDIINGNMELPENIDEGQWLLQWGLYQYLKSNTGLLSNPDINDFYENMQDQNIGKLYAVYQAMNDIQAHPDDYADLADAINESISPGNTIESNCKNVNEILIGLQQTDNPVLTEEQIDVLRSIAELCPLTGGPAVYQARHILAIYDDEYTEYEDECEQPQPGLGPKAGEELTGGKAATVQNTFLLYPNPSSGDVYLQYELQQQDKGELVVYDLRGEALVRYPLTGGKHTLPVHEMNIGSGVYQYSIMVNGYPVKTDRLIIIR